MNRKAPDDVFRTTPLWQTGKDKMHHEQFIVGWGTLSLINAGLAQSKNRSGLLWFLLSLLLGPIATFILVAFCGRLERRD